MAYSTIPKSSSYFNTKLYTGDASSSNAITGVGFQPDWTWIKGRNIAESHRLYDAVRGASNYVTANSSGAQSSSIPLTSFNADGFTIGTNDDSVNGSYNYASMNWKANGLGSSNSDGTITSTYTSANTTSGFSIVTYTGNGTGGATVGHGLGVAPKEVMVKSVGAAQDWRVYHSELGSTASLILNTSGPSNSDVWNNTDPTSSVFSLGTNSNVNSNSATYVAYCFAEIEGFSKFGFYLGNGNDDGVFIYTGFKPAFLIVKNSSITDNWSMFNNKALGYNTFNQIMYPDLALTESNGLPIDFLSNGFKWRTAAGMANGDGNNHIYMAFGQPIVSTNDDIATAF